MIEAIRQLVHDQILICTTFAGREYAVEVVFDKQTVRLGEGVWQGETARIEL